MDHMDPQLQSVGVQQQQQHQHDQDTQQQSTNEIPEQRPQEIQVKAAEDAEEQHEHPAFHPSLHYTSGNDLSSIANYNPQHAAGGPIRSGEGDPTGQSFDHWPADTQSQHVQEDVSLQNANQFAQVEQHNQFVPAPDHQYVHDGHQQQQQHHHHQHGGSPYERQTPGASYGTYDGSKPKRKRASPQQLTLLNNIFEMTYFPSSDLRLAIGKELDMIPRSVQIWFQNRRSLWRSKAGQILSENKQRKDELLASGMTEAQADAKVTADRAEAAARQIADQRANDAVEYAINGSNGSLAYALHGANTNTVAPGSVDDGSITRDDEAGAWSVLQAFHQARTGVLVQQGHAHPNAHMHMQHQHQQQHQQHHPHQPQHHLQQQQHQHQHQLPLPLPLPQQGQAEPMQGQPMHESQQEQQQQPSPGPGTASVERPQEPQLPSGVQSE